METTQNNTKESKNQVSQEVGNQLIMSMIPAAIGVAAGKLIYEEMLENKRKSVIEKR